MSDQHCQEVGIRSLQAQDTAVELFQLAALMLGNEEAAVSVVEETLAGVQADPCADAEAVQDEARPRLLNAAVRSLVQMHPGAFVVPAPSDSAATCLDSDDLSAAGMSGEQLDAVIRGPGRAQLRRWLEQLQPVQRAIFVLRAVAGQDGERTAESLRRSGGEGALGWQAEQVSAVYRQALCSLASSLVSSNAATALV
ncbi:MAG TPA: hypothetical protein VGR96_05580 [Acidobacteriaceae bacterium]|nr:hypothetical protein [Acidobacteriaceae bacterium]